MNIHNSYFSNVNPKQLFNRWLNPYKYRQSILLNDKSIIVEWTERADNELTNRQEMLIIECQLYFSCMVKKRVLFHDSVDFETTPVTQKIVISFRTVQSTACDPVEFAKNFPVTRVLTSAAAMKMHPSKLQFDFQHNSWTGEYYI